MARQKGIFPIQGTIGNVTFFKSKHGYLAREKGGIDASRIATAPEFQRTRENNFEFGRAGKAGKLFRDAFRTLLQKVSDSTVVARLTTEMLKVIKLDNTSTRGQRNVLDGELEMLQGFEANLSSKLSTSFFAPFTATINRVTGVMVTDIPAFVPTVMVAAPSGATHFKISVGGAEIDFENNTFVWDEKATSNLPINNAQTASISLSVNATPASTHPLFLALVIEFLQEVNGINYQLKNGSFNAMALIKIEGV